MNERDNPGTGSAADGSTAPYKYEYKYKYLYQQQSPEAATIHSSDADSKGVQTSESGQSSTPPPEGEKTPGPVTADKGKGRKRGVLLIIALAFILAGLAWWLYYVFVLSVHETTDDAYVNGDMVTISSRTDGTVVEVGVEDTDRVQAGQVLVRLDPVDAKISLLNAEGQLGQAVRNASQQIEQARQADAAVAQRRAEYQQRLSEYQRRHPLLAEHAVSSEDVDNGRRAVDAARAALAQADYSAAAAHAQVNGSTITDFPSVIQARAQFLNAWVNHFNDAVISPIDGYAARRQVQVGQHVQAGQTLLTVVPLRDLWIDANFKETQLKNIRIGQPVKITTDLYGDQAYHGKVVGLDAGTGAAFALLPAENATGNWIKVVQRLPVRVELDADELAKHPLRIGLSTYTTVDTHDRDGKVLATVPRAKPLLSTEVYQHELENADQAADAIIQANAAPAKGN